jgi:MFS family permease
MARFFDFYDPLEKRYVFNSFLVVVGLVEVLILVFTLVWQVDFESLFGEQVRAVPFPWKEYLLASFAAPIALLFLFGLIVQGFEMICREEAAASRGRKGRLGYLLGLLAFLAALVFFFQGKTALSLLASSVKSLGLGGAYLLIALMGLALLYLPLRLLLRYRLQKKALEYQYLLKLSERGLMVSEGPRQNLSQAESPEQLGDFPLPGSGADSRKEPRRD